MLPEISSCRLLILPIMFAWPAQMRLATVDDQSIQCLQMVLSPLLDRMCLAVETSCTQFGFTGRRNA